jgi:peptide/nickel transport system substrate-binding protein
LKKFQQRHGNVMRSSKSGGRTATWSGLVIPLVVFSGVLALTGCAADLVDDGTTGATAPAVESEAPPPPGGRMVYGLIAETNGWNPSSSQWASSGLQVAAALFDTLTAYDDQLRIRPNLAESVVPNADHTQWTITLREGVVFHNGEPADSHALLRNLEYLKRSPLVSPAFEPVASFTEQPPRSVAVHLKEPWVSYPYALATQIGVLAEPDWLESGDTGRPIGTGPFQLTEWIRDARLVVTKNPRYWRTGYPLLDAIEFRTITDAPNRTTGLEAGELDVVQMGDERTLSRFERSASGYQVIRDLVGEAPESFVQLNTMAPPFDDPDARRALALGTDRQAYVDTICHGACPVADGPYAPGSRWRVETDYPAYDPDAARRLVDQVKARHGGEFSFTLLAPPVPGAAESTQLLQQQWSAIGVDVRIQQVEQTAFILRVLTGDYQATTWQQFDAPHPVVDSIWWHPQTATPIPQFALNFARNRDPQLGAALDEARRTSDPNRERELYGEVQRRLAADIPYVWLFHARYGVIAKDTVVNIVRHELPDGARGLPMTGGAHPLWQIGLRAR